MRSVTDDETLELINKELNFEYLLRKYGPEGLYLIADKLKSIADDDISNSLSQL